MRNHHNTNTSQQKRPQGKRPTIGLLTYGAAEPLNHIMWAGVADAAREHDANLICFPGNPVRSAREFEASANVLYDLVSADNVDGLVIWSAVLAHHIDLEEMRKFCERFRPLPIINVGIPLKGLHNVSLDNYGGMRSAVLHLITVHDYRRIAFVHGPEKHQEAQARYRAYMDALKECGLPLELDLVTPGDFKRSAGAAAVRMLLDERKVAVEAVVAANDAMAIGVIEELEARGLHVPGDIAVVGLDDNEEGRCITPPLTTVPCLVYDQGRRAAEMVLALLHGEDVSEEVILPTKVVVRQSCGCPDPDVVRAAAGPVTAMHETFDALLKMQRQPLIAAMAEVVEVTGRTSAWVEQLLDAFAADMTGETSDSFLAALDGILRQVSAVNGDVAIWQRAISVLRRLALPCLNDKTVRARAEDLWQQARVMIGEMAKRKQAYQRVKLEQQAQTLNEIGQTLITTIDRAGLRSVLEHALPKLGITRGFLTLYENPNAPTTWSRLMMRYDEHGQVDAEADHQRFPSRQLAPDHVFSNDRRYSIVVEPLYFREQQLGLAVFEAGPREEKICDMLRGQISSALQGAFLVDELRKHRDHLEEANSEIHSLNEQLKEENLRMGAELDVSRRLQQMILPPAEELQQIKELEIVGFMQPADEVGGDYYDVLRENGIIHVGIGDVTGHGLESGVLMLMTQTAIRTLVEHGETDPLAFFTTLNRTIYHNVQRMHVDKTLSFALVNYQAGQLKIVGQHEELLVVRKNGQVERMDTVALGFPIGLEEDVAQFVAEATVSLSPGDGVVLYTDGITEAENLERKLYGIERLCEVISCHWNQPVEAIKRAVFDDVTRHIGKQKIYDDLTLVVLKQK